MISSSLANKMISSPQATKTAQDGSQGQGGIKAMAGAFRQVAGRSGTCLGGIKLEDKRRLDELKEKIEGNRL